MAATSSKGLGLVLVLFQYEYEGRDGVSISIKPNERYILMAKTNEHWWQVREDHGSRTFYIPAKYVKELPPDVPSPLDFADPPQPEPMLLPVTLPVPVPVPVPKPLEESLGPKTRAGDQVKIRLRPDGPAGYRKTENRMSTFGVPVDLQDPAPLTVMWNAPSGPAETSTSSSRTTNMVDDGVKHLSGFLEDLRYGTSRTQTQAIPVDPPVVPDPGDLQDKDPDSQETLIEPEEEEEEEEEEKEEQEEEVGSVKDEESNHIYESIQDLNLDLDSLISDRLGPERSPEPVSPPAAQEDISPSPKSPIYANVSRSPPPDHTPSLPPEVLSPAPSLSLQDHWQVSPTDLHSTGPLSSPSPTTSPDLVTSPPPQAADMSGRKWVGPAGEWKQLLDETSGRFYYYHAPTRTTRWDPPTTSTRSTTPPPLPQEDYPVEETAVCSMNPQQQPLLPRAQLEGKDGSSSPRRRHQEVAAEAPLRIMGNGVPEEASVMQVRNWRHSVAEDTFSQAHRRNISDFSQPSDRRNSPDSLQPTQRPELRRNLSDQSNHGSSQLTACHLLEKAGIINKTKVADCGKKIRKNWSQSWTVLHGGILTFHRDPKTAPSSTTTKSSQIVPEYTVELRGASVGWASKDKSSKKHVLELKTRQGCEYLMQYDTESIISDWFKVIHDTIRQLDQEHQSEDDEDNSDREDKERKRSTIRSSSGGATDSEQRRVRTKLRRFLQRRPTLQSVKERGYIRDNVFGCHLDTLCHRENSTVPRFLDKCVRVVDRRGLQVDGIYRVSGNLAVIQKLRHKADHEEHLDLDDGQWEEIHVITGALKLFLRELPEPLFPFSCFEKFIAAIQVPDYSLRVSYMKDLVRSLPLPNHNTMELLFKHLRRVIEHQDANRMSVQSLAIVFGPTLLRPQTESANMTIHMVFQSQIVELLLNEFHTIFLQTQEDTSQGPSRTL